MKRVRLWKLLLVAATTYLILTHTISVNETMKHKDITTQMEHKIYEMSKKKLDYDQINIPGGPYKMKANGERDVNIILNENDQIANDILRYEDDLAGPIDEIMPFENKTDNKHPEKLILLYNSFWGAKGWEVGLGREAFERLSCPVRNCRITDDKTLLDQSDAVLFHVHEIRKRPPVRKKINQKWIFFMLECPDLSFANNNFKSKQWSNKFNWTMTYRMDSDIRLHYGQVTMVTNPIQQAINYTSIVESKTGDIAWIVSNCNTASQRDVYVRELQKYINVDVYGRCGNLTCIKDWNGSDRACMEMINKTYKFYLGFENSICTDYVTEKFFKILPLNVIPIVRGGADYSKFAPEGSYIQTSKFESPKQLATYLKYLMKNPK